MLTGAMAASYYGTPRTTIDVDIVVKVSHKNLQALFTSLRKAEMRVDERKITNALESGLKIATLKDKRTSFTLDIIFSDKKLRKKRGTILGLSTFYQIPEELILSKLRMIKATIPKERALKDKDDIKAILRQTKVNMKIVKEQAQRENTLALFQELMIERENS